MERDRGSTRSGIRYSALNTAHYSSVQELMSHHRRLLSVEPASTTRAGIIVGANRHLTLLQTTLRFRFDSPLISVTLHNTFIDLFQEVSSNGLEGFEVVITFNAILHNQDSATYSLFYGQDHRRDNVGGVAKELGYSKNYIVRNMMDVDLIPSNFNEQQLLEEHQHSFEHSNLSIHSFVNVIFLIYQFVRREEKTLCGGFNLYKNYIQSFVLTEPDTNIVSNQRRPSLELSAISSFYKFTNHTEDPAFFNFFNFNCLTRLSKLLKISLVIYLKNTPKGTFSVFRDFRSVQQHFKVIYIAITRDGKLYTAQCQDSVIRNIVSLPQFIDASSITKIDNNWIKTISVMCNLPCTNFDLEVNCHQDLNCHSQILFDMWKKRILIISFSTYKTLYAMKTKQIMSSGKNIFFSTLGYIAEKGYKISAENCFDNIICFYTPNLCCFLQPYIHQYILKNLLCPVNLDKISSSNYQQIPVLTQIEKDDYKEHHKQKQKSKKADLIEKLCKCEICKKSDYNDNMSKAGPEQLDIIEPHIQSLLKMLNLDTNENLMIIEQLCELSVAAFDIESMTISSDFLYVDEKFPVDEIEHRGTEAFTKQIQKPIMISHCDSLSEKTGMDLTFTTASDKEEDIYNMMIEYWEAVCKQAEKAVKKKKKLVQPLLIELKKYSAMFFNTCAGLNESTENKNVGNWESAWKNTLFGKLDTALTKLIDKYIIFSFYGSGYDHVLIESYLIPHLFETQCKPVIQKSGNKVTSIHSRSKKITFRDITKLLAPSTNLRSFGKLFSLKQSKAHFPFSKLTSINYLSETKLPSDLADWTSDISGKTITLEEIKEAQTLFEQNKCSNVGEYLKIYLKLDVAILYKATNLWRCQLKQQIGIDFIESHKFTIASLTHFAGGINMTQNKRIGNFFPNNSQVYRLLRQGMRGGLCSIFRRQAGNTFQEDNKEKEELNINSNNYCHNSHWIKTDSDNSNYVGYYDATSLYPSSELDDMPVGTGTLFVQHSKNSNLLVRESKACNATETQESQVIQYIAHGGYKHYSKYLSTFEDEPTYIISSIHSGPGQVTFGYTRQQKADLILIFSSTKDHPAVIFVHNYHGRGPYGHYDGHLSNCRLNNCSIDSKCIIEEETEKMDNFKKLLASKLSTINYNKLVIEYSTSYACQFFCGNPLSSLKLTGKTYISLHELLNLDFPNPTDKIFIPRYFQNTRKILNIGSLISDICTGKQTGFVTLKGGNEKNTHNALDYFGFCIQKIAPTTEMLSEFTINQIKDYYKLKSIDEVNKFLLSLPERTLNAKTFFTEETISTTYLQWLIKERGFSNFTITHFIAYKFSNYSREFLDPLLQKRHEFKQQGNDTAASCLKVSVNSNYGFKGMEATNYSRTKITTGTQLIRYRAKKMGHLDLRHITMLGLVKIQKKKKKSGKKQKTIEELDDSINYFEDDDNDDDDDDDDDEFETQLNCENYNDVNYEENYHKTKKNVKNSDNSMVNIKHDHSYSYVCQQSKKKTDQQKLLETSYNIEMLYAVTISGKQTKIKNCLPKAIAILSNSKKLFLGHIKILLECLNPRLAELCYIDTDSCFFSMTYPTLEQCLMENKKDEFVFRNIMANEKDVLSCHGKMKCEGVFKGAKFRSLKVYRLYNELNLLKPENTISHCKGVNTFTATFLPENMFDLTNKYSIFVTKSSLRPTRTGEILIVKESKKLAIPFNLKRFVCNDSIHTFPFFYEID